MKGIKRMLFLIVLIAALLWWHDNKESATESTGEVTELNSGAELTE